MKNKINIRLTILLIILICNDGVTQTINSPLDISGLRLWLTGDSVQVSSGSNINKCYDLSGFNNHANQNTNSKQPTVVSSLLNSHKVMNYDGNDFMSFNEIDSIRSCFMVLKYNGATSSDYPPILGHSSFGDFIGSTGTLLFGTPYISPFISAGVMKINTNLVNPAIVVKPINYSILSIAATGNLRAEYITNDRNTYGYWNGEYAEIIIYNQQLNPSQVFQIEKYLNDKYAPQVLLPNDISTISVCDTILKLVNPNNNQYSNYQWSTGATTPTISVNKSGKYWVNATNIFGKLSSDTILVNMPNYNKPLQSAICSNTSLLWNTNLSKKQFSFQWQDNSTDSIFNINQAGNYYVTITDSLGCSITSDTAKIIIDNFSNTASLGPDTSLCAGNYITLTSGLSPALTYTWSTGSNSSSLLINTGGQYSVSVAVTNTNNCVARDTINVNVVGFAPTANFNTSIGCINSIVYFTDLSVPPSGNTIFSYDWNFGDVLSATNTSTLGNPFHTYSDTGLYVISLKVTTNAGCEQSISKTINIAPKPTANFSNGISCQNDSTLFLNSSTSSAGYFITALNWNFGDPISLLANTSTLQTPKHLFSNQGNYNVKLTATNNAGCKDSIISTIIVRAEISASFTNSPACAFSPIIFQDNSIVPPPSASHPRLWNFGTNTSSGLSVSKTYTSSGIYSVTLTVTGTNGCVSTTSKILNVFLPPVSSFSLPTLCLNDTSTITNSSTAQSGILSSNVWKFNNVQFSAAQTPTITSAIAATYTVGLVVTNSFGCIDSTTKLLTVLPLPVADFTTNPISNYYSSSLITFTPTLTNATSYNWDISGIPTTTVQSPTTSFTNVGTYTISLNLVDQFGCKNSKTKTISINKRYLDMAILSVKTIKDNDGFMTISADVANYGSVPITTFNMNYQISDGGNIKETWTGLLNANSFYGYTFSSKSASQIETSNNITCVEIEAVNGALDENTTNNYLCSALNVNEISVSNPIPNPTDGDITLPIVLNRDVDFTITIYSSIGQIRYEEITRKGTTGLNFVTLPASNFARGCYIIKIIIDDKVFIQKFIKTDAK